MLVAAPAEVVLERPFTVQLKLRNQVDRPLGPLHVTLSPSAGELVWQLQKGCSAGAMLPICSLEQQEVLSTECCCLTSEKCTACSAAATSPAAAASTTKSDIVCCGLENVEVQQLHPKGSADVQLTFVAVSQGSQRIAGIACVDQADGKLLDVLSPVEVLVK